MLPILQWGLFVVGSPHLQPHADSTAMIAMRNGPRKRTLQMILLRFEGNDRQTLGTDEGIAIPDTGHSGFTDKATGLGMSIHGPCHFRFLTQAQRNDEASR